MKKLFLLLIVLIGSPSLFGQDKTFSTSDGETNNEQQQVLSEDKKYILQGNLMIVPFEPKMYISGIDRDVARNTGMSFDEIQYEFRKGLMMEIYSACLFKQKSILMGEEDTTDMAKDLKYIYYSIGYKYQPVTEKLEVDKPLENSEEEDKTAIDKVGDKMNDLFGKKEKKPTNNDGPTRLENGQIVGGPDNTEKFMNTKIINPNALPYLQRKYGSSYFLFVNELDFISPTTDDQYKIALNNYPRQIKVHFTVVDVNGKEIYGGAAYAEFSSRMNDPEKIIQIYFPKIAKLIAEKVPSSQNEEEVSNKGGDTTIQR